jgi:hypothetical protein
LWSQQGITKHCLSCNNHQYLVFCMRRFHLWDVWNMLMGLIWSELSLIWRELHLRFFWDWNKLQAKLSNCGSLEALLWLNCVSKFIWFGFEALLLVCGKISHICDIFVTHLKWRLYVYVIPKGDSNPTQVNRTNYRTT